MATHLPNTFFINPMVLKNNFLYILLTKQIKSQIYNLNYRQRYLSVEFLLHNLLSKN